MFLKNKIFRIEFLFFGLIIISAGAYHLFQKLNEKSNFENSEKIAKVSNEDLSNPHLIILGIAQDAGYPQADCKKSCCAQLWNDKSNRKMVSSIGLRDPQSKKAWMFDATPDFKDQLKILLQDEYELAGIFLTHAHMGHYTGLMHLGREAMGSKSVPVYVMPRMEKYLQDNGPWSQLINLENIALTPINDNQKITLENQLSVTPFLVPHRDEFSETVGFNISSKNKSAIFIPDIDKWDKWDTDINAEIEKVNWAFLDGTFYKNGEIWGRDMSQIPHPFIEESMARFSSLNTLDKSKIQFIHLNHTNPLLNETSKEYDDLKHFGFSVAKELDIYNF